MKGFWVPSFSFWGSVTRHSSLPCRPGPARSTFASSAVGSYSMAMCLERMRCRDWQVASLDPVGSRSRELRLPELSLGLAMTYAVFQLPTSLASLQLQYLWTRLRLISSFALMRRNRAFNHVLGMLFRGVRISNFFVVHPVANTCSILDPSHPDRHPANHHDTVPIESCRAPFPNAVLVSRRISALTLVSPAPYMLFAYLQPLRCLMTSCSAP